MSSIGWVLVILLALIFAGIILAGRRWCRCEPQVAQDERRRLGPPPGPAA